MPYQFVTDGVQPFRGSLRAERQIPKAQAVPALLAGMAALGMSPTIPPRSDHKVFRPRTIRARILLLFVGLALVPFLVSALVLERRADQILERVVAGNAGAVAAGIGAELDAHLQRALDVGRALANRDVMPEDVDPAGLRGVRAIEVMGVDAQPVVRWTGADTAHAGTLCGPDPLRAFQHDAFLPGRSRALDQQIRVTMDPGWVLDRHDLPRLLGASGILAVQAPGGAVLASGSCADLAETGGLAATSEGAARVTWALAGAPWSVVARVDAGTLHPWLAELDRTFIIIALLVAALATVLFVLSLRGVTSSLEQLMDAADRMGAGDFNIWLPPPGEDETGRLSYALSAMATRVEQSMERMKRVGQMAAAGEVASYMTHEIRNPLSSLRLNLQTLSRRADELNLEERDRRALALCQDEIDRLESVSSGVLRIGQSERSRVGEITELHRVVKQAHDLLTPRLERDGVLVDLRFNAQENLIRCDARRLEGVFINLLLNAADAMADGGTITIRTEESELAGHPAVTVRISDTGPGVPPHLRSRIFEPFFTTRQGGSGIGLSVAAQTIHDHAGTIQVAPRESVKEGAVFEIVLPQVTEAPSTPPPPQPWPPSIGRTGPRGRGAPETTVPSRI